MDVRKKLVELLLDMPFGNSTEEAEQAHAENVAEYLIDNGVTVQEWISVKDRLPERFVDVLCYFPEKDYGSNVMVNYNESTNGEIAVFADQYKWGKVTHWTPIPEPPKGE